MVNWAGKVRLDTVLLRCNNNYCHNLYFPRTTKIQLCLNRNFSSFKKAKRPKHFITGKQIQQIWLIWAYNGQTATLPRLNRFQLNGFFFIKGCSQLTKQLFWIRKEKRNNSNLSEKQTHLSNYLFWTKYSSSSIEMSKKSFMSRICFCLNTSSLSKQF